MQTSVLKLPSEFTILTLQKICLMSISINLCNIQQLLSLIKECSFHEHFCCRINPRKGKEWESVRAKANEILQICKSKILRESILEFLWLPSYKITLWRSKYAPYHLSKYLHHLYWIDRRRIDNLRTAKYMIENKNVPVKERFRLACTLCSSKEIHEVWDEMSNEDKGYFFRNHRGQFRRLLLFWAHFMEGSDDGVITYIQDALECAILNGLSEAIKNIFSILDEDTKYHNLKYDKAIFCTFELNEKIRVHLFLEEDEIEIGVFLLSQIECIVENRGVINFDYGLLSLTLLLHSPDHESFLKALLKEIEFGKWYDAYTMLRMMFYMYYLEINHGNDYQKLFIDVWKAIPASLRKYIGTSTDLGAHCLGILIKHDFPFLLKKRAFEKVAELTLSDFNRIVTPSGLNREKWEFLFFLIEEEVVTIPSLKKWLKCSIKPNKLAEKRVLRFIRKVIRKSLQ